jgi:hypothetical protein
MHSDGVPSGYHRGRRANITIAYDHGGISVAPTHGSPIAAENHDLSVFGYSSYRQRTSCKLDALSSNAGQQNFSLH